MFPLVFKHHLGEFLNQVYVAETTETKTLNLKVEGFFLITVNSPYPRMYVDVCVGRFISKQSIQCSFTTAWTVKTLRWIGLSECLLRSERIQCKFVHTSLSDN